MEYAQKVTSYLFPKLRTYPLRRQYLPLQEEFNAKFQHYQGLLDPIGDLRNHKTSQIIHRYKNRVLFLCTSTCPVVCRFCFRKNSPENSSAIFKKNLAQTIDYLQNHSEINEIIYTGGDPFVLSPQRIENSLTHFSKIKHIESIRFHTRVPLVAPEKINTTLLNLLQKYKVRFNIQIIIHCNHSDELFNRAKTALHQISNRDIPLLSQTVLLKRVNDDPKILINLFKNLTKIHVRPYYLHHPDRVVGAMHFYIQKRKGLEIFSAVRSQLSGWQIPSYVQDSPEGISKAPVHLNLFS